MLKQFKCKVEFLININDIPDDVSDITEDLLYNDESLGRLENSDFMTYQNRQKRVFYALLADEEMLKRYVDRVFPELVEFDGRELVEKFLSARDNYFETDRVINSIIETLNQDDRDFFEKTAKVESLNEHLELVSQAFDLDISEMTIEEVKTS